MEKIQQKVKIIKKGTDSDENDKVVQKSRKYFIPRFVQQNMENIKKGGKSRK
jgi:hypothetical protein